MTWLTVIAVLVFVYSFYSVVLGEPSTSPYEDERAKLPAHQYAYASKLSANYTRKSWRIWAGANLVLAALARCGSSCESPTSQTRSRAAARGVARRRGTRRVPGDTLGRGFRSNR